MLAFIKDYWKSSLLGALCALVLLYIGILIYDGLNPSRPQEAPNAGTHNTARPPPPGAAPGGHWHGDEWHDAPSAPPPKIKRVRTKTNTLQNPALKNIGPILPITNCIIEPAPPLPADIQERIKQLSREMRIAGTLYEIRNGSLEISEAAHKRNYEVLVGDMAPEDAVDFLEAHGVYNPFILDKLEPRRAIDYLYKVRARQVTRETYARRVLARDPDNPDAQMVMLRAEPDNATAAAGYRLHYEHPAVAIRYLKKANSLDATIGYFSLGLAYERLGDVKTAWLYYRKQQTIENGSLVEVHKRAIEKGEPIYAQVSLAAFPMPGSDATPLDIGTAPHEQTLAPVAEEAPWLPEFPSQERDPSENQPTDKERREAARAEFQRQQAAAQQEFDEFHKWVESIMSAEDTINLG